MTVRLRSRLRNVADLAGLTLYHARHLRGSDFGWKVNRPFEIDLPGPHGSRKSVRICVTLELGRFPDIEKMARTGPIRTREGGNGREAAETLRKAAAVHLEDLDAKVARAVAMFRVETWSLEQNLSQSERSRMYRAIHEEIGGRQINTASDSVESDVLARLRAVRVETSVSADAGPAEIGRMRVRTGFDDFVARFPLARSMGREVELHVGPTNSGKTHAAMALLAAAKAGVYLAPLRLLALEGREILDAMGVRAGMITGEEYDVPEDATHLSQTVETASFDQRLDVAVIDEVQMLADRDRGWAWSAALFGIPARKLVLCGSQESLPLVRRACDLTGERLVVVEHVRKNSLILQPKPVAMRDIRAGDAVIAFSRRDVFAVRERIVAMGHSVATVYGGLAPDVRRAEAARFRAGDADVLVATDAIGMGLNFGPLKRVVFSSLSKFDGISPRELHSHEIRQIAGRAGRFGHAASGYVAVLSPLSIERVATALEAAPVPPPADFRFPVAPVRRTVEIAAEETGMVDLAAILRMLRLRLTDAQSPFRPSGFEDTLDMASVLRDVPLPVGEKFDFATCPLELKDYRNAALLVAWARARAGGGVALVPRYAGRRHLDEMEAAVKRQTAYLWLAHKYPETFTGSSEVVAERAEINAAIEEFLVASARRRAQRRTERTMRTS